MEYGTRAVSAQVYLDEAVLLGSVYVPTSDVAGYLNVSGHWLHLHQLMWFPYREGTSALNRREAVLAKDDVLFVVHRADPPAVAGAEDQRDDWQPVEVATGRFVLRGLADLGSAGTIHNLIASPERFFLLRDVSIEGPIGATFSEPQVIVNADAVSFATVR
ncbi:MAG TPA: hypothetical protein VFN57_02095 [Thermomicrobiaceae bacterium]|nr:hypothetical protein [Thermomicrobiaceae bacterium]